MSLPSGYTQLEYIQSSGAQYVDTEFRPKNTTKVMIDFQVTAQPKSHQIIFGERTSYSGADQFVLGYTGHKSPAVWRSDFGSSQVSFPSTVLWSTRMTAVRNGPDCTLNGTAVKNSSAVFSSTHNLFLLANNDNETAAGHISAKLYLCQISDGEKIARFFIPCKNAGGAVGLYDLIGKKFYGNAGTGTFTAGPVVAVIPDAPSNLQQTMSVRLIWAEVSGAEQYNVYRDDTLLGTTTGLFYVDDTAAENTEYTYAVSAVNSAGESPKTTISVYTKTGYFLYKPLIQSATFQ